MISTPSLSNARRTRARRGFTLIESMVVVSIIGLLAAAVLPAMTEMMAGTRQQAVATEMLLLARRAQREAIFSGYAYAFVFHQDGGGGDGGVQVVTGLTSHCARSANIDYGTDPLSQVRLPLGFPSANGSLQLSDYKLGGHRILGRMELAPGAPVNWSGICYSPRGTTSLFRLGQATTEQQAPAVLFVRRVLGSNERGVTREIVFPPGGSARPR